MSALRGAGTLCSQVLLNKSTGRHSQLSVNGDGVCGLAVACCVGVGACGGGSVKRLAWSTGHSSMLVSQPSAPGITRSKLSALRHEEARSMKNKKITLSAII